LGIDRFITRSVTICSTRLRPQRSPNSLLYVVIFEGVRGGSVESLPRSPRPTRWIARPADGTETARFPTRRDASAWLIARHREQRGRDA
jgi:hypothetical protein